jgi:hypothetical protein
VNKKSNREKELTDFRKSLESFSKKDFDGHSDFQKLSVREKLEWLSELNYFKNFVKKNK